MREWESDYAAELVAGIGAVPSCFWRSMVLVSGRIERWQIALSGLQFGAVEIAGKHYEAVTPPGGCCVR